LFSGAVVVVLWRPAGGLLDTVTQNVYEEMASITLLSIRCSFGDRQIPRHQDLYWRYARLHRARRAWRR
jgi:hypothetical protein